MAGNAPNRRCSPSPGTRDDAARVHRHRVRDTAPGEGAVHVTPAPDGNRELRRQRCPADAAGAELDLPPMRPPHRLVSRHVSTRTGQPAVAVRVREGADGGGADDPDGSDHRRPTRAGRARRPSPSSVQSDVTSRALPWSYERGRDPQPRDRSSRSRSMIRRFREVRAGGEQGLALVMVLGITLGAHPAGQRRRRDGDQQPAPWSVQPGLERRPGRGLRRGRGVPVAAGQRHVVLPLGNPAAPYSVETAAT